MDFMCMLVCALFSSLAEIKSRAVIICGKCESAYSRFSLRTESLCETTLIFFLYAKKVNLGILGQNVRNLWAFQWFKNINIDHYAYSIHRKLGSIVLDCFFFADQ